MKVEAHVGALRDGRVVPVHRAAPAHRLILELVLIFDAERVDEAGGGGDRPASVATTITTNDWQQAA